jgi:hypothetical protein
LEGLSKSLDRGGAKVWLSLATISTQVDLLNALILLQNCSDEITTSLKHISAEVDNLEVGIILWVMLVLYRQT